MREAKMAKLRDPQRLKDGIYRAKCKESTPLKALINGHGPVWPESDLTVRDGWAFFSKDGTVVWDCNSAYAATHFSVTPSKG